jgi:hypothetical protein
MTEYKDMSDSEKKKEDWMNNKWRPMMGWLYMAVCAFDFVIFPILWSLLHAIMHSTNMTQWQPLTLQGAGLFHIAMGAVLGIAALGRTQEKLAGANNGGASPAPTGFGVPSPTPSSFQAPTAPSFGAPSAPSSFGGGGFGSVPSKPATPAPSFSAPATASVGFSSSGKPMPVQPDQPEL